MAVSFKPLESRLGHAYSAHGITGTLGWALAPAVMVPMALAFGWRVSMLVDSAMPGRAAPCWRRR